MVLPDKKDILIPQGITHSVDRVMFPLPVGDVLQTLQSDRERRFTNFLRALFSAGLSELLQNKGLLNFFCLLIKGTETFNFLTNFFILNHETRSIKWKNIHRFCTNRCRFLKHNTGGIKFHANR